MGDGRYYTWDQFFSVVFLTLLLMAICVRGVITNYQGFKSGGRLVLAAHGLLGVAAAMRFAATVLVSPETAFIARKYELFCLMITEVAVFYLVGLGSKRLLALFKGLLPCFACAAVLLTMWDSWLIQSHTLSSLTFGRGYIAFTGGLALLSFAAALDAREQMGPMILLALPLGLHAGLAHADGRAGDASLMLLYPPLLMGLHLFSADLRAYRIGDRIFSNINNLINDAVLFVDGNNTIAYQNQHAKDADYLNPGVSPLPHTDPTALLAQGMIPVQRYNIPAYSPPSGERYYECRTHPLDKGVSGRFYIFSEITRDIEMLDLQDEQRQKLEEADQRLRQYSHMVYDLEKEKEIGSLLTDITSSQESFMDEFKHRIQDLSHCKDTDTFHDRVDELLVDARDNLSRIRTLVAKYRRYHGTRH